MSIAIWLQSVVRETDYDRLGFGRQMVGSGQRVGRECMCVG